MWILVWRCPWARRSRKGLQKELPETLMDVQDRAVGLARRALTSHWMQGKAVEGVCHCQHRLRALSIEGC